MELTLDSKGEIIAVPPMPGWSDRRARLQLQKRLYAVLFVEEWEASQRAQNEIRIQEKQKGKSVRKRGRTMTKNKVSKKTEMSSTTK